MIGVDRCSRTRKLTAPAGGTRGPSGGQGDQPSRAASGTRRNQCSGSATPSFSRAASSSRTPDGSPCDLESAAKHTPRARARTQQNRRRCSKKRLCLSRCTNGKDIVPSVSTSAPSGTDSMSRKRRSELGGCAKLNADVARVVRRRNDQPASTRSDVAASTVGSAPRSRSQRAHRRRFVPTRRSNDSNIDAVRCCSLAASQVNSTRG